MPEPLALDAAAVLWSHTPTDLAGRHLIVLLHGYGSDERDLFGLTAYLPAEFVVASVAAPLAPPWPMPGRSWYPIEGLDGRDPSHVTAAGEALIAWVDAHAAPAASVGLLGFSQGAAVSLQALRLQPERFAYAVNLSGYATPGALPRDAELAEVRPPVFWGRGTRDDVIPSPLVEHTVEWLPAHTDLSGRVYPGLTHSVSEAELDDVRAFLDKQLEGFASGAD
ncbi:alpha/beta hydrolase [Microbacterium thalassium]|uniref:Phospholipase/carboxylesterase n=1 Tax=Microbacterium thalassium TaxID=362649 RepID=A0A7X0FPR5_9MICO|nr:alpha/beta hydrolase-fold protein [Microbacterium thalassium]MBB6390955.1 phospholipase/carboxylesterase [Microbacterium thalassium]GLK26064.1 phospholipase/carboxylesterase [Microbacterium thalassium]